MTMAIEIRLKAPSRSRLLEALRADWRHGHFLKLCDEPLHFFSSQEPKPMGRFFAGGGIISSGTVSKIALNLLSQLRSSATSLRARSACAPRIWRNRTKARITIGVGVSQPDRILPTQNASRPTAEGTSTSSP